MKRLFRQVCTFLAVLLIVIAVRTPYYENRDEFVDALKAYAKEAGVHLEIEEAQLSFPADASMKNIQLVVPLTDAVVPLTIEQVQLELRWLPLLIFNTVFDAVGNAYSGELTSKFKYPLFSDNVHFELLLKDMQLASHPVLEGLGFSGVMNANLSAAIDKYTQSLADASFALRITRGSLADGKLTFGIIPLPGMQDLQLELNGEKTGDRVFLKHLKLSSSLGDMQGEGGISLEKNIAISRVALSFTIALNNEGIKELGSYFSLAAGISPENPPRNWQLRVLKRPSDKGPTCSIAPGPDVS